MTHCSPRLGAIVRGRTAATPPPQRRRARAAPKINGAIAAGTRKLVVITGASSGLGKEAARALTATDDHYVIMAVRDVEKGKAVAKAEGFPSGSYTVSCVRDRGSVA